MKVLICAVVASVVVLTVLWFHPIRAEAIYGDYTHISPHPVCSGWCVDEWDEDFYGVSWENLSGRDRANFSLSHSCCIWHQEPYPLKGGHAYYNIFGVEIYREWEWIS
jgi:hypothetical protein